MSPHVRSRARARLRVIPRCVLPDVCRSCHPRRGWGSSPDTIVDLFRFRRDEARSPPPEWPLRHPCVLHTPKLVPEAHSHPSEGPVAGVHVLHLCGFSRELPTRADAGAREGREGFDKRASAIGNGDKAAVPGFGPLYNSCPDAGMRSRFGRSLPPRSIRGGIHLINVFCRAAAQAAISYTAGPSSVRNAPNNTIWYRRVPSGVRKRMFVFREKRIIFVLTGIDNDGLKKHAVSRSASEGQ